MTKIYSIKPCFDVGEFFLKSEVLTNEETIQAYKKLDFWEKTVIDIDDWESPPCYISYKDEDTGEAFVYSDIPSNTNGYLVFNRKAKEALADFVAPYGQFLPLDCQEDEIYILNIFNVIDCLDLDKSVLLFRESLDMNDPSPVVDDWTGYRFDVDKITDASLLRLPYKNHCDTYFTQDFVDEVERHHLTGFAYRLLWDSDKNYD